MATFAIERDTPAGEEAEGESMVKREPWMKGRLATFAIRLLVIAALIGLWQFVSVTELVDPFFVSSPSQVASLLWSRRRRAVFRRRVGDPARGAAGLRARSRGRRRAGLLARLVTPSERCRHADP